ncbi:FMN-linked oxidoreductase [Aspergillus homomorphus CBS 101889]|uniref:FMN-linked oxidoreductase n=1 Tax=Aspergillus homomorphus (strain CBS 101889) TaxID=1450537 RepID=A0A395HXK1_ASPHC|nr:FMN-linked oxidoreductase [Aspergillus homomorphus CBS 101889]RAL12651.1 FMN-linked oxidoreductase [Aspergillus homomorphus CBS 101889]
MATSIFEPLSLGGAIPMRTRVIMGSMTRNRCINQGMPNDSLARYYADHARDGCGAIIVEGTFIAPRGAEWPNAPVMREISDLGLTVDGSYLRFVSQGHTDNITEIEDPHEIVEQLRRSVILAKEAGFDEVRLLSQGGYLLHNFPFSHSNVRTNQYGGTTIHRMLVSSCSPRLRLSKAGDLQTPGQRFGTFQIIVSVSGLTGLLILGSVLDAQHNTVYSGLQIFASVCALLGTLFIGVSTLLLRKARQARKI